MQMKGEQVVPADRQAVWAALNDPAVLAQCIPGCQSLERDGDNRFAAVAEVKIGPIGARFKGNVELSDIDAPNGYTITGSGSGGVAGSARGGARVRLSDAPGGGTVVTYDVDADVGGRMAQLGGPIIDATAKNLAGKFFTKFGEVVGGGQAAAPALAAPAVGEAPVAAVAQAAPAYVPAPLPAPASMPWGWVLAVVVAILLGFGIGQAGYGAPLLLLVAVLLVVVAATAFEAGRRGAGR
jgi:carbon monoxide dehydrogenase subunit G